MVGPLLLIYLILHTLFFRGSMRQRLLATLIAIDKDDLTRSSFVGADDFGRAFASRRGSSVPNGQGDSDHSFTSSVRQHARCCVAGDTARQLVPLSRVVLAVSAPLLALGSPAAILAIRALLPLAPSAWQGRGSSLEGAPYELSRFQMRQLNARLWWALLGSVCWVGALGFLVAQLGGAVVRPLTDLFD